MYTEAAAKRPLYAFFEWLRERRQFPYQSVWFIEVDIDAISVV